MKRSGRAKWLRSPGPTISAICKSAPISCARGDEVTAVRVSLGAPGRRRMLNGLERRVLSAGLTVVALVADWLLARRLAHDRKQTPGHGEAKGGRGVSASDAPRPAG